MRVSNLRFQECVPQVVCTLETQIWLEVLLTKDKVVCTMLWLLGSMESESSRGYRFESQRLTHE